ncbi:hypothetical protein [Dictyobacter alpinus]|nr:hypothetical protein [Dictyobacter alpinus]
MRRETLPLVNDYMIRYLTLADHIQVLNLCERCADYIELVTGDKPGPETVQSIFTELPAGKTYNDKLLLGIFTPGEKLIGILDAIRHYPTEHEWYLNLLLLDPAKRNLGRRLTPARRAPMVQRLRRKNVYRFRGLGHLSWSGCPLSGRS